MRRRRICGFESGDFYQRTPTDGTIVIDATSKRTGSFGMHVTSTSGIKSSVQVDANGRATCISLFHRWYMRVISLPATARLFCILSSSTIGVGTTELRLNTDGTISVMSNGSLLGTSSIALTANRFYRIEIAVGDDGFVKLLIDGITQLDWTYTGSGKTPSGTDLFFGALDTVAATMEYYIDDYSSDEYVFPGNGRIYRRAPSALRTDNATFSLVGAASKLAAISEAPVFDDDTGYLLTSTTNNDITFDMEGAPPDAVVVRGQQFYSRIKRDGASNGAISLRPAAFAGVYTNTVPASTSASTASYISYDYPSFVDTGPISAFYSDDVLADYQITIRNASGNATRITAVWGEMDIDDSANATQDATPFLVTTFSQGEFDLKAFGNVATMGTVARNTLITRENGDSIKVTHAASGFSHQRTTIPSGSQGVWWNNGREVYFSFWFYADTLPSSGSMGLCYVESGGIFVGYAVTIGSDGSVNTTARTSGAGTPTAAGTVVTDQWYHVTMYLRCDTGVANGVIKVWLDETLIINRTGVNGGVTTLAANFALGSGAAVAGGAIVYYDNFVIDFTQRHPRNIHFGMLVPSAAGSLTQASFTANGAASKWECIDDIPDNDDTDYVLVPSGTTLSESYETTDLDSLAEVVHGFTVFVVAKRDGATNGAIAVGVVDDQNSRGISAQTREQTLATTASELLAAASYMYGERSGRLDPQIINSMELRLRQNSANASRVTSLFGVVLYARTSPRASSRGSSAQIIG